MPNKSVAVFDSRSAVRSSTSLIFSRHSRSSQGFTLVEAVAALVFVGFVAVLMATVVSKSKHEGVEIARETKAILAKKSCAERLTADLVANVGNLVARRDQLLAHLRDRPDICPGTPSIVVEENGTSAGKSVNRTDFPTSVARASARSENEQWVDNHIEVCVPTSRDWPGGQLVIKYSCFSSTYDNSDIPENPGTGEGEGSVIRVEIDGIQMEVMP